MSDIKIEADEVHASLIAENGKVHLLLRLSFGDGEDVVDARLEMNPDQGDAFVALCQEALAAARAGKSWP